MKRNSPTHLLPEAMYSLKGFQAAAGFSSSRMWELRQQGIRPVTLRVGRRIFIRGVDAINYIEAAAALTAAEEPAAKLES